MFPTGKIKKAFAGFHHYIAGHLEEMGITLFNTRTCNKTGISISDVLCDGYLEPNKTFFPTSWTREQVISKIAEAARNPIQQLEIQGSKGILYGQTSEGIVIRIIMDTQSGNYITAYPDAYKNGLI